jgi:hypothetical protein
MFLALTLLGDSGYMARAAFVMDRFMRWVGLPGKSFVPMLVGFGCNEPAIMATRTLENKRDRYMTIFMNPFMSCGARLPVYALFAAAFFGTAAGGHDLLSLSGGYRGCHSHRASSQAHSCSKESLLTLSWNCHNNTIRHALGPSCGIRGGACLCS